MRPRHRSARYHLAVALLEPPPEALGGHEGTGAEHVPQDREESPFRVPPGDRVPPARQRDPRAHGRPVTGRPDEQEEA
ncbi:MAG: hypothetical protein QG608_2616 [Actinomycetota bacterium]|nr:hypothetical protein [Actinomycetota bacterium]